MATPSFFRRRRGFATTRWSVVLEAGRETSPASSKALSQLCEDYWYPLYAYVRHRGYATEAAQDLTQAFFANLLEKNYLRRADPGRGKFRTFLLTSLKNFLTSEWRRTQTLKRGGQVEVLSLDFVAGEERYRLDPAHRETPEKLYERRWALCIVDQALFRLRREYEEQGKLELFMALKGYLVGGGEAPAYREIARRLGQREGAVRVAVLRLRRRCGKVLRQQIAETVGDPQQVDEELAYLFASVDPDRG